MFVKSVFFVLSNIVLPTSSIPDRPCNRLEINDTWYEREVIIPNIGRPYHLIVQQSTNNLFFGYSVPDPFPDADFQIGYINLDTKEQQIVPGMKGGCTVAIDQVNDEIYLGGSDGIYKYNMFTRIADVYKEKGKNIWALYFKDNLFYISYPDQRLYIDVDGKFIKVIEFENFEVDNFHVAVNHDIYFSNKTGFYKLNKINSEESVIDVVSELLIVRQIVEDNEGFLYICTNFGIYVRINDEFTRIVNIKNVFGLTFDKENHLIYSDERNIIRLKPSDGGCKKEINW